MFRRFAAASVVGLCALLAISGCNAAGARPKLGKVHGTVTYQGKPLTKGEVIFTPASGKGGESGDVATGKIESDGTYTLTTFNTDDGAILGQHVVTVIVRGGDIKELNKPRADGSIPYILPKPVIPEKYAASEKTPLKYTIVEGENKIDLELKD